MAYLSPVTPPNTKPLISTLSRKTTHLVTPRSQKVYACCSAHTDQQKHVRRRSIALVLGGVVLGLSENARAAARRPPPPPPQEKKDPNLSAAAAKVLASKKRKEAMKESIAKLREKGKPIQEPPK